jgi:hypothetical protein
MVDCNLKKTVLGGSKMENLLNNKQKDGLFQTLWQGSAFSRSATYDPVPSISQKEAVFSALMQGPNGLKRVPKGSPCQLYR